MKEKYNLMNGKYDKIFRKKMEENIKFLNNVGQMSLNPIRQVLFSRGRAK